MFLLLRNIYTEDIEVLNVSAIQTARPYSNPAFCNGTTVVWNTDGKYIRGSQFDMQREGHYDITFEDFIDKIVDAGLMHWCA